MRVLCIEPGPAFSVADCHAGWKKAFLNLGCSVVNCNLSDRLNLYSNAHLKKGGRWKPAFNNEAAVELAAKGIEVAAFEFWPDVVFITSGFFVPKFTLELLRARGMKVVLLFTESPYENDAQMSRAPFVDWCLLNDPTGIVDFREVNPNTYYAPHAYDPDIHYPRPPKDDLASDFTFVGTGFPSRIEFFEQVDWTGIDVTLAGNWSRVTEDSPLHPFLAHERDECVDNTDAVDLYCSAKSSANLYRIEAERPELSKGWACGPREIELAACGTWFLRQSRGEGDALFPSLPIFDSPESFGEQLRWWLDNPELRVKAATEARMAVADRTFEANAKRLLSLLSD